MKKENTFSPYTESVRVLESELNLYLSENGVSRYTCEYFIQKCLDIKSDCIKRVNKTDDSISLVVNKLVDTDNALKDALTSQEQTQLENERLEKELQLWKDRAHKLQSR